MKLHIFNPEHDLVLANNSNNYTPSSGILKMREGLSYIPVFWASPGDVILTDNISASVTENKVHGIPEADVIFSTYHDLNKFSFDSIEPWGWDKTLKNNLIRCGVNPSLIPTDSELETIRNMSHRRNVLPAMQVLRDGLEDDTCGDGIECNNVEEINDVLLTLNHIVIKAPWSSSGINIIYVHDTMSESLTKRCQKLIDKQGSLMVEPIYNKVKDFAMEFNVSDDGTVRYVGLSVFETLGTAYLNNIISSETQKLEIISKYISPNLLEEIKSRICSYMSVVCKNRYKGPFGIDMMVVLNDGRFVIDPCVEINLRYTMGHVAIARWNCMNQKKASL